LKWGHVVWSPYQIYLPDVTKVQATSDLKTADEMENWSHIKSVCSLSFYPTNSLEIHPFGAIPPQNAREVTCGLPAFSDTNHQISKS
jgi:hypothetical protein